MKKASTLKPLVTMTYDLVLGYHQRTITFIQFHSHGLDHFVVLFSNNFEWRRPPGFPPQSDIIKNLPSIESKSRDLNENVLITRQRTRYYTISHFDQNKGMKIIPYLKKIDVWVRVFIWVEGKAKKYTRLALQTPGSGGNECIGTADGKLLHLNGYTKREGNNLLAIHAMRTHTCFTLSCPSRQSMLGRPLFPSCLWWEKIMRTFPALSIAD